MPRSPSAAVGLTCLLGCVAAAWGQYPTHAQIGTTLANTEAAYPALAKVYNIGNSAQGRALWVIRISDNVGVEEDEPEIRYISTMHGDEVVGVEMCLRFINYLTTNYGTNTRVTNLVDNTDMWIMPLMNPDGYTAGTRGNSSGTDLNRDFPDYGEPNSSVGRQVETGLIMNWTGQRHFVVSANFHGGSVVVNYPFDNDLPPGGRHSSEEDVFYWMAEQYAQHNLPMWNSSSFFHGITNGADWYSIDGGMQDYSVHFHGDMHFTIELSNIKTPSYSTITTFWNDNRESMLGFFETSLTGVRGIVTDAVTGEPLNARITVPGRQSLTVRTDPDVGNYHRLLRPGTYTLNIEAEGYYTETIPNVTVAAGPATRLDVVFQPAPVVAAQSLPSATANVEYGPVQLEALGGRPPLEWELATSVAYAEQDLGSSSYAEAGAALNFHTDDGYTNYALPFAFPFYGESYTSVRINANGFIDFGAHSGSTYNNSTSLLQTNRMIAPLWDDLDLRGALGDIYIDATTAGQVTIRWDAVTRTGQYPVEFAVTLFEDGDIRFDYGSGNNPVSPTIGISDGDGLAYTLSAYDGQTSLDGADSVQLSQGSSLPAGLTFDSDGVLSGTPQETGTFAIAVRVTDSVGRSAEGVVTLEVEEAAASATGDYDADGDVDLFDFAAFQQCFGSVAEGDCALAFEFVTDGGVIDLADFAAMAVQLAGPEPQ